MRARAQWAQSGRFQLYDYGSGATNRAHYGSAVPLDVAGNYRLLDFPVDIMAGPPRLPRLLLQSRSTRLLIFCLATCTSSALKIVSHLKGTKATMPPGAVCTCL